MKKLKFDDLDYAYCVYSEKAIKKLLEMGFKDNSNKPRIEWLYLYYK